MRSRLLQTTKVKATSPAWNPHVLSVFMPSRMVPIGGVEVKSPETVMTSRKLMIRLPIVMVNQVKEFSSWIFRSRFGMPVILQP